MSTLKTTCGFRVEQGQEYSDYGNRLVRSIEELRHEEQLCDVVLSSEGKNFPAHKLILAATSPFFHRLFTVEMSEKNKQEVELSNIDPQILVRVLEYIYTGKLSSITASEARELFVAADYLILPGLQEMATKILEQALSADVCLQTMAWSHRFSNRKLFAHAFRFALDNFGRVSRTADFLKLSAQELRLLLGSNNLRIVDEEDVYEALRRWTEHRGGKRHTFFAELFGLIRLKYISSFYKEHVIYQDIIRFGDQHLRREFSELLNTQSHSENAASAIIDPLQPPRRQVAMVIAVLSPEVYLYIPTTREWREMEPVPSPRVSSSSAMYGGRLYNIGGLGHSGDSSNTVECFDPSANAWLPKASLPVPTRAAGAAVLGEFLYIAGGRSNSARLNIVQRYDPHKDSWTLVTSLRDSRSGAALVSCHGKLYAIGGRRDESTFLRSVECYRPRTNTWSLTSPMSIARASCAAAYTQDKIYVIGGVRSPGISHTSCEAYDIVLNQWHVMADTIVPRSFAGVAAFKDSLLVCGGEDSGNFHDTVEYYDIHQDTWQVVDKMPREEKFVDCFTMFMSKDLLPVFPCLKNE